MVELSNVLIVEDEQASRDVIEILLASGKYRLYFAENGEEGLAKAVLLEPDVILLDVMLPKLDGFQVCRKIRSTPHIAAIPILMISTLDDHKSRLTGLQAGADDFIQKPFDGLELKARLSTLTQLNRYRQIVNQRKELEKLHEDLLVSYNKTIEGWSHALDLRDKETEGHTQRVTEMTLKMARAIGLGEEMIPHIWRGALLHDVGKLGIPDAILLKPGKLTQEEWLVMRQHPVYAYEWLSSIEYLGPALDIPYCHHEKWNGSGYPRGLCGEDIPIAARVFAIVDVWDAITSDRPYHKAMSFEEARDYIIANAGLHFDPAIVEVFLKLVTRNEPG
jgi:putative two-component system response regulator